MIAGAYLALMGFGNLIGTFLNVKKVLPLISHVTVAQILMLLALTCMNVAFAATGATLLLRRAWARPLALTLLIAETPLFAYGMMLGLPVEARGMGAFVCNVAVMGGWHTLMICALYKRVKNG